MKPFLVLFALLLPLIAAYKGGEEFSIPLAQNRMAMAYSSYCNSSSIQNWDCYWCSKGFAPKGVKVTHVFSGDSGSTFGFAGYSKTEIVFSFRGTVIRNIQNWITDLNAKRVVPFKDSIPGAYVHQGFMLAYNTVKDKVIEASISLTKKLGKKVPVVITGHSLGGAIGTLAAADIALHPATGNDVTIWTFGSPRVGNDIFANFIDKFYLKSYRLVNHRDLVPSVPWMLTGFQHVDREFFAPTANSTLIRPCKKGVGEDKTCSDSLLVKDVFDHFKYLENDQRDGHPYDCY